MFHIAKRVTTETTWTTLFHDRSPVTGTMENLDTFVAVDWRGFMVELAADTPNAEAQPALFAGVVVHKERNSDESTQYVAECPYIRHKSGSYCLRNMDADIRTIAEFSYIHICPMSKQDELVTRTAFTAEVKKSRHLQQRLRCTALEHMANRRMHAKDAYFDALEYDIAMYTKFVVELDSGEQQYAGMSTACEGSAPTGRAIQDDDSSVRVMLRD